MDGTASTIALIALIALASIALFTIYRAVIKGRLKRANIAFGGAEMELEGPDLASIPGGSNGSAITASDPAEEAAMKKPALRTAEWEKYVDIDLNQYFGRTEQLAQIAELVSQGPSSTITAIRGVGGIGKTASAFKAVQTALEYRYSMVAWSSFRHSRDARGVGTNRGSLEVLRDLSTQLGLTINTSDTSIAREFSRALIKGSQNDEILLVVDNLEQLVDFEAIVSFFTEKELLGRCHLLLTTRVLPTRDKGPLRRFLLPPLAPASSFDLIRHEGAESPDVASATNVQLSPIHGATDGNPYLMKLVAKRLAHSSEHMERVLRDLQEIDRERTDNLAAAIERYMFRASIEQLIEFATRANAESLLYAFLTQPPGSQVPYSILLHDSGLGTDAFDQTLDRAHALSLVTSNTLSGTYSIHSLLHSYLSAPRDGRAQ